MNKVNKSLAAIILGLKLVCLAAQGGSFTNLLSIDFEPAENYTNGKSLFGQSLWFLTPSETNGSGLTSIWPGFGQQAFVGGSPLAPPDDNLLVAYPLNFTPTADFQYVSFSVMMEISGSTHGGSDNFAWFFINYDGLELLGVDFYNSLNGVIGYETAHGNTINQSSATFKNSTMYRLEIDLDFIKGTWTASLGDQSITPSPQPIGEPGDAMNLRAPVGLWAYDKPALPGDNAMYFDHLRAIAGPSLPAVAPPVLAISAVTTNSAVMISVSTEPGLPYSLETSPDLQQWAPLTNTYATNLEWTVMDSFPFIRNHKFYRAYEGKTPEQPPPF